MLSGVALLYQAPEFLLLFGGQDLTDVMQQRDMHHLEVHLFGGDGLEGGLHAIQIDGVRPELLPEVHVHRVDLGLEPNALFGMGAQQRVHRVLLALIEVQLLQKPLEVLSVMGEVAVSMLRGLGQRHWHPTRSHDECEQG
jgi:hypothetical protein